jgi:DNA-binding transcriptional regulator YiaG
MNYLNLFTAMKSEIDKRNLTLPQVAEAIDTNLATLRGWIFDGSKPAQQHTSKAFMRLVDMLETNLDDFADTTTQHGRIEVLRWKNKMSVMDVVRAVQCSRSSFNRWESGRLLEINNRHLSGLAATLNTTTDYILSGDKKQTRNGLLIFAQPTVQIEIEGVMPDSTIPPESADLTNQKVILSIEIAVFAELPHSEIMSDIEAAIKEMKRLNLKFSYESRSYLSVSGEQLKCYALDRDAMFALIVNYSRVARAKIVRHWVDNIQNPKDADAVPPVEPIVEPVVEPEVEQEAEPVVEPEVEPIEEAEDLELPATTGQVMSSVEIVKIINKMREEGKAVLTHDNFMKKVVKVLGEEAAVKFNASYKGKDGTTRKCYALPKREAHLMVMSENYKVQAAVYDRMVELEEKLTSGNAEPKVEPKESSLLEKLMTNNAIIKEALCGFNMLGVEGNQAALGANKLAAQETGFNILEMIGQSAIVSPVQERYYTPTQLGDNYKMTAQAFNNLLLEKGYQVKNGDKWAATEKGKQFSVVTDTNKKNSTGTVQQLFWYESIIKEIGI